MSASFPLKVLIKYFKADGETFKLKVIPKNLRASIGKLIINLYIDKEPRTPIITPSLVKVIDVQKKKKKKKKGLFGSFGIRWGSKNKETDDEVGDSEDV